MSSGRDNSDKKKYLDILQKITEGKVTLTEDKFYLKNAAGNLELQRSGVQIFISTHDYILAKYFEVKEMKEDQIKFYSLYKEGTAVKCETCDNFRDLKNNWITKAFNQLLDEVYEKNIGE